MFKGNQTKAKSSKPLYFEVNDEQTCNYHGERGKIKLNGRGHNTLKSSDNYTNAH